MTARWPHCSRYGHHAHRTTVGDPRRERVEHLGRQPGVKRKRKHGQGARTLAAPPVGQTGSAEPPDQRLTSRLIPQDQHSTSPTGLAMLPTQPRRCAESARRQGCRAVRKRETRTSVEPVHEGGWSSRSHRPCKGRERTVQVSHPLRRGHTRNPPRLHAVSASGPPPPDPFVPRRDRQGLCRRKHPT